MKKLFLFALIFAPLFVCAQTQLDLGTQVKNTLPAANGGLGVSSLTPHCVVVGAGTSSAHLVCPVSSGYVLTDNGISLDPTFQAPIGGGSGNVSTTPAAGVSQTITQLPSSGGVQSSFNLNTLNGRTIAPLSGASATTNGYNWIQSPTSPSSLSAGAMTVTLPNGCPPGLLQILPGSAQPYVFVHIAGTGTAEDAVITSTTCTQHGGAAGTITFTAANSHSSGYTVQSSSQGFQEAIDDSGYHPTNYTYPQQGVTTIPPGNYSFTARVTILEHGQTVDMSGATVTCKMNDTCIYIGDANPNQTFDVTLISPVGQPGVTNSTHAFIEDNGQKTRIFNGQTRSNLPATFGSWVQVDGDTSFHLDGLDAPLGDGMRCDSTFCGAWITAPGPFNPNAAVGWISHVQLGLQCGGNGIYWGSGNSLHVSDSIIEGVAQYAVMGGPGLHGGFLGTELDNVYVESGGCSNPLGNIGSMGMFEYAGILKVRGGNDLTYPIGGTLPSFASTGATQYYYYAVINDTTASTHSAPYLFGQAASNGSGSITLTWPCVTNGAHTITYDILRETGTGTFVPYGTGNYSVATGVAQAGGAVCTATDTNSAPGSYTVALQSYQPTFILQGQTAPGGQPMEFWPGGTILTGGAIAFIDDYAPNASNGGYFVSTAASTAGGSIATYPTVFADKCEAGPFAGSPIYVVCPANGGGEGVAGTALNATILGFGIGASGAGSGENNLKGRLIFEKGPGTNYAGPTHWMTLADSNPAKTAAYGSGRPPNDASDVWVGLDPTGVTALNAVPMAFGSPVSISNYIGSVGDGSSWLERLTATTKTLNVNEVVNGNFTVTGSCTGCSGSAGNLTGDVTSVGLATTAVKIPPGVTLTGTPSAGKVPTATSSSAATWQTPSGGGGYSMTTAPDFYLLPYGLASGLVVQATPSATANYGYMSMLQIDRTLTFTKVSIDVYATSNGNNAYIGIYNLTGTLIWQAKFPLTAATGWYTVTISSATMSPGSYFLVTGSDGSGSQLFGSSNGNTSGAALSTGLNTSSIRVGYNAAQIVSGALVTSITPSSFTSYTQPTPWVLLEP